MLIISRTAPAVTVLLMVLISVMPWGLGPSFQFAMPAMPFAAIHYWTRARDGHMSTWMVFAAGLTVDVLSYGPLGYWAMIYLAGLTLTILLQRSSSDSGSITGLASFTFVIAGLLFSAWALASGYFMRLIDWTPMFWAAALLIGIYPVIHLLLAPVESWAARPRALNLERRA